MATELTNGDILIYTLNYTMAGQRMMNTWHFQVQQFEPALVDYEDVCDAILTELQDPGDLIESLQAETVTGLEFTDHRLQRVFPTRNRAVVRPLNIIGEIATTPAPPNTAIVVTKYGNTAGRFAIGSWHQPGIPMASLLPDGTLGIPVRAAMKNAVEKLLLSTTITGFAGTTLGSVLWSANVPARVTPIAELVTQATTRVMRRRTVGVGI